MRRARRFVLTSLLLAAARAEADPLVDVVDRGAARVVLDGVVREWSGALAAVDEASQVTAGAGAWRGADDASFAFAVARDDEGLYLAAEVRDDRVVRTRQHRPTDDALVLTIAFPNGRLWTAWEVSLQPGEPGAFAGAVRYRVPRARPVPGAQVVEAPSRGGFTLEAKIPWSALPGLRENLGAARVRVAYEDSDQEAHPSVETVLANGGGDARHPQDLPPTSAAAPAVAAASVDLLARFRRERGVAESVRPLLDRRVDLAGGPEPERVVVFPRHIVAFGPGVAGGSYTFLEFPSGEVESAQAVDLTGDRKADVAVTLRASGGAFERSIVHVYSLDAAGAFQRLFAREVGRRDGASRVANEVRYQGGRVALSVGDARGYTAATWPNVAEPGVEPPLTPWGAHRAEVYAWSPASRSFVLERSEPNPTAASAAPVEPSPNEAVEAPEPGPDVAGVLSLFRQRERVPEGARPTHRVTADVAEDPAPEQLYVYGRTLVVVGPRFMGGRSYASIGLPASPGDEVVSLRAADITDDGRAEAIVTVRRTVTVQVQGAANTSQRDMAFAYSFDPAHRGRVFAVEVARRVGGDAIVSELVLPRGRRGNEVAVESRPARGWTEATYPFHDAPPQGYEPLLLPWATQRRVTWRWNGSAMARAP